eukprot:5285669-Pyramimonas_sp.AAC.2
MSAQQSTELRSRYSRLDDQTKLQRLVQGESPDGVDYASYLVHNGTRTFTIAEQAQMLRLLDVLTSQWIKT